MRAAGRARAAAGGDGGSAASGAAARHAARRIRSHARARHAAVWCAFCLGWQCSLGWQCALLEAVTVNPYPMTAAGLGGARGMHSASAGGTPLTGSSREGPQGEVETLKVRRAALQRPAASRHTGPGRRASLAMAPLSASLLAERSPQPSALLCLPPLEATRVCSASHPQAQLAAMQRELSVELGALKREFAANQARQQEQVTTDAEGMGAWSMQGRTRGRAAYRTRAPARARPLLYTAIHCRTLLPAACHQAVELRAREDNIRRTR
jgi:hypothetical protein